MVTGRIKNLYEGLHVQMIKSAPWRFLVKEFLFTFSVAHKNTLYILEVLICDLQGSHPYLLASLLHPCLCIAAFHGKFPAVEQKNIAKPSFLETLTSWRNTVYSSLRQVKLFLVTNSFSLMEPRLKVLCARNPNF